MPLYATICRCTDNRVCPGHRSHRCRCCTRCAIGTPPPLRAWRACLSHQQPVLFAQRCRATAQRSDVTISPWQISFVIRGPFIHAQHVAATGKNDRDALKQSALMTGRVRRSFSGGADGERREGGAQSHRLCHKPLALSWASCV